MSFSPAQTLSRLLTILILLSIALPAWAYQAGTPINATEQLAPYKNYYDSRDDWPRSHGWKPFMRYQWDIEQRAFPDGTIPAGALWEAYLHRGRMPRATLDEEWAPLGPYNHGGRTRVIRFHPENPDIMFAGSVGGGLFKSVNAGQNWFPITDQLPNLAIGSFEIHPMNPDIMFLGTGEGYFNGDAIHGIGLLKSTDGGLTWNTTGLAYPYSQGTAILTINLDPRDPNIVFASTNNGLFRSTNGGVTFGMVRSGNVSALERDPQNPDILVCGIGSPFGGGTADIFRSTDNGLNWSSAESGLPMSSRIGRVVLDFYEPNSQVVYAGICGTFNYNGSQMIGVYRSIDNGVNWVRMSQDGQNHYASQGWYDMAIAVSPANPSVVFSSGLDLYRSTNAGFHWTRATRWDFSFGNPRYVHADHHEIVFHPDNPEEVWAATDGGIFKSEDDGINWVEMNQDYVTFQYYAMGNATLDTILAYGGTQDNGTSRYDGSPDWPMVFGGDGGYCVVDYTDDNTIYVEYQNGNRFRSDDGGNSFHSINAGIDGSGPWVTPMVLDPFDHLTLYTTTNGGGAGVWKSDNQGRAGSWERIGSVGSSNQVLEVSRAMQGRLYLGSGSGVYRYDEEVGEWTAVNGNLPNGYITRVVPDPFDPDVVYVTQSGFVHGHVFKSTQAGTVWEDISGNLPDVPFQDVVVDLTEPNTLYAGGDIGVYRTLDGGQNWEVFGNGLPAVRVDDMDMQTVTGKLRVATHGRGIWEIPTGSSDLALLYPNGGETLAVGDEIQFRWAGITHEGDIAMDINRSFPDGEWESLFDAVDNTGSISWTINGSASDDVRFRIVHLNIEGQSDTSDAATRIAEPRLTVVYPNGGETILSGVFDTLRFERILVDDPLLLEINRDYPDGEWEVVQSGVGTIDELLYRVELPGGEHVRVRVTSEERPELTDESDADFLLRAPEMTLIAPNGGEAIPLEETYSIQWDAPEHQGSMRITMNLDYPDGAWTPITNNTLNDGSHPWTPTGTITDHARVRVAAIFDPLQTFVVSAEDFSLFSLAAGDEATLPTDYRVSEPYPNPFNPTTLIQLQLPARTRVEARVFNHLGQEVAVIANRDMEPGSHKLELNGANLSSGTYYIHVTAFEKTSIHKAVLIK